MIANDMSEVNINAVGELARQRRFDYLVIESTGISEPDAGGSDLRLGVRRRFQPG